MTRVFVSYASQDYRKALQVSGWLDDAKVEARADRRHFQPGANFILEMSREAEAADLTLVLGTSNYFRATYTSPEWSVAFARSLREGRPRLLLARFDDDLGLPTILEPYLWVDLRGLQETDAEAALVEGVRRALTGAAGVRTPPGSGGPPTSPRQPNAAADSWQAPRRVVATRGGIAAGRDIAGAVVRNIGFPAGLSTGPAGDIAPSGDGVFADGGAIAAGRDVGDARIENVARADESPDGIAGVVPCGAEVLGLAVVGGLLADARLHQGELAWAASLPAARLEALETALTGLDAKVGDVRDMVETLWAPAASAQNRTALQQFAKSLPDRTAWEVLKLAALGVLP